MKLPINLHYSKLCDRVQQAGAKYPEVYEKMHYGVLE